MIFCISKILVQSFVGDYYYKKNPILIHLQKQNKVIIISKILNEIYIYIDEQ
jgi:hypothetical protein